MHYDDIFLETCCFLIAPSRCSAVAAALVCTEQRLDTRLPTCSDALKGTASNDVRLTWGFCDVNWGATSVFPRVVNPVFFFYQSLKLSPLYV